MNNSVSVVGLGKLGVCFAADLADAGYDVVGVDIQRDVIESINAGKAHLVEPGLDDLIAKHGGKTLRASLDHGMAIDETDVTFVLVATPSNPDGSFSNRYVESALKSLSKGLKGSDKEHHLFVISSTVVPGSTEGSFIPLIEEVSGRTLNEGFSVAFDPDFVALGNVVQGFKNPELVILGESRPEAGEAVEAIHKKMCDNDPPVFRMSLINAEIAKVSLNAYITVKLSFANTVANICEQIPGADVDAITQSIGVDRRISPYFFTGGLSFGGTCFPRDTVAFSKISEGASIPPLLMEAVDAVNSYQDEHLADKTEAKLKEFDDPTLGVIGVAFKDKTPVITEAAGMKLAAAMAERGYRLAIYDALALDNAQVVLEDKAEYVSSPEDCLGQSDVCVLISRDKDTAEAVENYEAEKPIYVIDCWRNVDPARVHDNVTLLPLGVGMRTRG